MRLSETAPSAAPRECGSGFFCWVDKHQAAITVPLQALVIVVLALIIRHVLRRVIDRVVKTVTTEQHWRRGPSTEAAAVLAGERRRQRAEALGSMLRSVVSITILIIASLMILELFGANLAPIIASAGILGAALGFGAQNLVKDFLAGTAVILEDQYGVGDVIDTGLATGTVEDVGLRITRVRDVNGVIWYVRNGEVTRIGNKTQGSAVVPLDILIAYDENLDSVNEIIRRVAAAMRADEQWAPRMLDDAIIRGVESMAGDAITIRVDLTTAPLSQGDVSREFRARLKAAFDEAGVRVPSPIRGFGTAPGTPSAR